MVVMPSNPHVSFLVPPDNTLLTIEKKAWRFGFLFFFLPAGWMDGWAA